MTQVDFYHLQKQTLDEVLPKLLDKAYSTGKRIKVKVGTDERVEFINSALWSFEDQAFLPHGSKKDGFAEEQPIWLSSSDDKPNGAVFLFLVDGALIDMEKPQNMSEFLIFLTATSKVQSNRRAIFGKLAKHKVSLSIIGNKMTTANGSKPLSFFCFRIFYRDWCTNKTPLFFELRAGFWFYWL